jgi:hypothetical protein
VPDAPAPRARRRLRAGRAPEPGVETHPLGIPRQQTRPLPVVGAGPVADTQPAPRSPQGPAPDATPWGPGTGPRKLTVTRVAAARTRQLSGATVRRVRAYGRADGAGETGLAGLFWVNALHMAGDAMIAVSLAGTLFFAAASDAQRGNVAL